MANERLTVRKIKDILRLSLAGVSKSKIQEITNISRKTIREYLHQAECTQVNFADIADLSDIEIYKKLFPETTVAKTELKPQPDWAYVIQEMKRKHVTLLQLHREYIEQYPQGIQYSQFGEYYRRFVKKLDITMRQTHRYGEKGFVDYAGDTVQVIDSNTGEVCKAQIFVAVLGGSNYTYAEATWTQSIPDWVQSHCNAFVYFGGVPELTVPDNLKSAVDKACRYEPLINRTYYDMAEHFGTVIMPTRIIHPKDKAKVEGGVLLVERWILAALRNRKFFSLVELNTEIRRLLEILNERPFQKLPGSRKSIFLEHEQSKLKPLPETMYVPALWKKAKVAPDSHIDLEHHYYSVPCQHIGEQVDVCYSAQLVTIYKDGVRLCSHQRSRIPGQQTVVTEHLPKSHQEYKSITPEKLLALAANIGKNTSTLAYRILHARPHPALGFRSVQGLIGLCRHYDALRIENACAKALLSNATSYRSVRSILEKKLDLVPEERTNVTTIQHENIRGPEYYKEQELFA